MTNASLTKRSIWLKFFEVFFLLFVIIGLAAVNDNIAQKEYEFVTQTAKTWEAIAVMIMVSFIIAFFWQRSGKGGQFTQVLLIIIIFYVAFCISMYGFAKLLKTQFQAPQYIKDTPVRELNGFWLTWVYYGYSQTMANIIGVTQVGGSILLTFKRTRLAGVFILLPVMVNICLINHFYAISPLAYFNSLHYTLILLFLLFLDYDKLITLFAYTKQPYIHWKSVMLTIARVGVIGSAFLLICGLRSNVSPVTKINGVWLLQSITKNNVPLTVNNCEDSVWSKLYFEWRYGCLFKYNLNKFEDKDLYGNYHVDERQHTLSIAFSDGSSPTDSTLFHYQFVNDSTLNLSGNYQHDLLAMKLKRMK